MGAGYAGRSTGGPWPPEEAISTTHRRIRDRLPRTADVPALRRDDRHLDDRDVRAHLHQRLRVGARALERGAVLHGGADGRRHGAGDARLHALDDVPQRQAESGHRGCRPRADGRRLHPVALPGAGRRHGLHEGHDPPPLHRDPDQRAGRHRGRPRTRAGRRDHRRAAQGDQGDGLADRRHRRARPRHHPGGGRAAPGARLRGPGPGAGAGTGGHRPRAVPDAPGRRGPRTTRVTCAAPLRCRPCPDSATP